MLSCVSEQGQFVHHVPGLDVILCVGAGSVRPPHPRARCYPVCRSRVSSSTTSPGSMLSCVSEQGQFVHHVPGLDVILCVGAGSVRPPHPRARCYPACRSSVSSSTTSPGSMLSCVPEQGQFVHHIPGLDVILRVGAVSVRTPHPRARCYPVCRSSVPIGRREKLKSVRKLVKNDYETISVKFSLRSKLWPPGAKNVSENPRHLGNYYRYTESENGIRKRIKFPTALLSDLT